MMKFFLVAFGFLLIHFYVYYFFATNEVYPDRKELRNFPLTIQQWQCPAVEPMDIKTEANLGVSDYLICTYRNPNSQKDVGVYLGYHKSQVRKEGGGGKTTAIHTPKHCLPGSGWDIIQASAMILNLEGLPQRPAKINRLIIAKENQRQVVYYWYHSQGRIIAEDWRKAVYLFLDRATRHRTDGALVRFTVPITQNSTAAESDVIFESLATEMLPLLNEYIPN